MREKTRVSAVRLPSPRSRPTTERLARRVKPVDSKRPRTRPGVPGPRDNALKCGECRARARAHPRPPSRHCRFVVRAPR